MNLSDENAESVWYTLVGLKQLKQNFDKDKNVWNMIANKALLALRERLGFTGNLEAILGQLKTGSLT
jgi:hypothetical protein